MQHMSSPQVETEPYQISLLLPKSQLKRFVLYQNEKNNTSFECAFFLTVDLFLFQMPFRCNFKSVSRLKTDTSENTTDLHWTCCLLHDCFRLTFFTVYLSVPAVKAEHTVCVSLCQCCCWVQWPEVTLSLCSCSGKYPSISNKWSESSDPPGAAGCWKLLEEHSSSVCLTLPASHQLELHVGFATSHYVVVSKELIIVYSCRHVKARYKWHMMCVTDTHPLLFFASPHATHTNEDVPETFPRCRHTPALLKTSSFITYTLCSGP